MATYLVLSPSWVRARGMAENVMHQPGAVIAFEGRPGVALYPLNDKARAARLKVILARPLSQRAADELAVKRFRAVLQPKTKVAQLDAAIREFADCQIAIEKAAAGKKS